MQIGPLWRRNRSRNEPSGALIEAVVGEDVPVRHPQDRIDRCIPRITAPLERGSDMKTAFAGIVALGALALASCAPTITDNPGATAPPLQTGAATRGASEEFAPRKVAINFSGDLLWHDTLWAAAEIDGGGTMDFEPQLAALADYVSQADLAICHSEVPFAKEGGPYGNYPMFQAPPEIAEALAKIGWDLCTTASNHALDAGFEGLVRTIEQHEAVGILTAGTYASKADSETPVIFTTDDGVKIGVVSLTYGTNGIPLPQGKPWSVSLLDADAGLAQAQRAKDAGADIVVAHMHAGTEYDSNPNAEQIEFAEAMTASDAVDLVIGQHAHVVQPITRINDKWVAYGAGNLIADSGPAQPHTFEGFLATFTFTEQEDGSFTSDAAEFAPTFITKFSSAAPTRVYIISDALEEGLGDAAALNASAARTRKTVLSLGAEGLTER